MRLPKDGLEWLQAHLLASILMVIVGNWSLYNVIIVIIIGLIIWWLDRHRVIRVGE